jgi:hypothetical protein
MKIIIVSNLSGDNFDGKAIPDLMRKEVMILKYII